LCYIIVKTYLLHLHLFIFYITNKTNGIKNMFNFEIVLFQEPERNR